METRWIVTCLAAAGALAWAVPEDAEGGERPRFVAHKLGGHSGRLGDLNSFSQLALGPDGHLYATRTVPGQIWRYRLDPETGFPLDEELLVNEGQLLNGLVFDPGATAQAPVFYYSLIDEGGRVYRVTAGSWGSGIAEQVLLIDGIGQMLNHAINNMTFGTGGLLYLTLAGQDFSGAKTERPWTAAIAEADLSHPAFATPPVDISSPVVLGDTVYTGSEPIRLFATGLRNPHGILQHSNGHLYATTHDPFDRDKILHPDGSGALLQATTRVPDMLVRVERGKYYGHTNPTRGEFLYFGGNPTAGVDPFEIPELPVGTSTAMDLDLVLGIDHHLCIAGLDEYVDGSLLVGYILEKAYYSQDSVMQGFVEWFDLDPGGGFARGGEGDLLSWHDYVQDARGKPITFAGAMDVLVVPNGRIYVADFGMRSGPDGQGESAGLYLLEPTPPLAIAQRRPWGDRPGLRLTPEGMRYLGPSGARDFRGRLLEPVPGSP